MQCDNKEIVNYFQKDLTTVKSTFKNENNHQEWDKAFSGELGKQWTQRMGMEQTGRRQVLQEFGQKMEKRGHISQLPLAGLIGISFVIRSTISSGCAILPNNHENGPNGPWFTTYQWDHLGSWRLWRSKTSADWRGIEGSLNCAADVTIPLLTKWGSLPIGD